MTWLFDGYKIKQKQEAKNIYTQAMLTASFVGSAFAGGKAPTLFEAFPDLFEEEAEAEKLDKIRSQMLTYASLWNAKQKAKEG